MPLWAYVILRCLAKRSLEGCWSALPRRSEIHLQCIQPANDAVDRKDDAAIVDEHVVDLAPPVLRLGDVRHKIADLLGLVWVFQIEGAQAAAEKRAEDDVLALPAA